MRFRAGPEGLRGAGAFFHARAFRTIALNLNPLDCADADVIVAAVAEGSGARAGMAGDKGGHRHGRDACDASDALPFAPGEDGGGDESRRRKRVRCGDDLRSLASIPKCSKASFIAICFSRGQGLTRSSPWRLWAEANVRP